MEDLNIISGNKAALIGEFRGLYKIHEKKWRPLLKLHNDWHSTDKGLVAWKNACRGTVGNEVLRRIISDMKAVVSQQSKPTIMKRQGLTAKLKT